MPKKAFIVTISTSFRIVADLPENPTEDEIFNRLHLRSLDIFYQSVSDGQVNQYNISEIEEDDEIPYDPKYDD